MRLPEPSFELWHVWRRLDEGRIGKENQLLAGILSHRMRRRERLFGLELYGAVFLEGAGRGNWGRIL